MSGLGCLTIFLAGIRAIIELDIKKVIALSTLSQLGLIFMTLGIGLPVIAFFHLASHAYFKAMLFICAGGVIHRMKEFQDLRTIGSGIKSLPFALRIFVVANIRLCGIPFMSGFYSKDLILETLLISSINVVIFFIAFFATLLTVAYSLRVIYFIYFCEPKTEPGFSLREIDNTIKLSLMLLLAFSAIGGLGISWLLSSHLCVVFLPP